MKKIDVVYFAHPVSGNVTDNIACAKRWLALLIELEPNVAFAAPWLPYVEVLDDSIPPNRERGLRDNLAIARRCDGIVFCGTRVSDGMRREFDAVVNDARGWCSDLTGPDALDGIDRIDAYRSDGIRGLLLGGRDRFLEKWFV